MTAVNVHLSSRGIANTHLDYDEPKFEFVLSGRSYPCKRFVADFLSPHAADLRSFDPSIDRYEIGVEDARSEFPQFLSLGYGQALSLNSDSAAFFLRIAAALESTELYDTILDFPEPPDLTVDIALDRFLGKRTFRSNRDLERSFLSLHFWELTDEQLQKLNFIDCYELFSDSSLRIVSDDWLCAIILNRMVNSNEFVHLLEFVDFRFLSSSATASFADRSDDFLPFLSISLWTQICDRLVLALGHNSFVRVSTAIVPPIYTFDATSPFNGIIAGLTKACGGNVHERGLVNITSSSQCDGIDNRISCAVDLENCNTGFVSEDIPNQWLCLDFKDVRVAPTFYTIRSWFQGASCWEWSCYLDSWVIEGSTDEVTWDELDRRDGIDSLRRGKHATFPLAASRKYRFIRIRQLGPTSGGWNHLLVSAIEIFGDLW